MPFGAGTIFTRPAPCFLWTPWAVLYLKPQPAAAGDLAEQPAQPAPVFHPDDGMVSSGEGKQLLPGALIATTRVRAGVVMADYFGLSYTVIKVPYGHLVGCARRIRRCRRSGGMFCDAASYSWRPATPSIKRRWKPRGRPDSQEPPVAPRGQSVYLCFRSPAVPDSDVLDALDQEGATATFS